VSEHATLVIHRLKRHRFFGDVTFRSRPTNCDPGSPTREAVRVVAIQLVL
jgi:hypothetical protein